MTLAYRGPTTGASASSSSASLVEVGVGDDAAHDPDGGAGGGGGGGGGGGADCSHGSHGGHGNGAVTIDEGIARAFGAAEWGPKGRESPSRHLPLHRPAARWCWRPPLNPPATP